MLNIKLIKTKELWHQVMKKKTKKKVLRSKKKPRHQKRIFFTKTSETSGKKNLPQKKPHKLCEVFTNVF